MLKYATIDEAQQDAVSIESRELAGLQVQMFNFSKHYTILCEWFSMAGKPAPDLDLVSDEGLVVEANGTPLAMISIYRTPSRLAFTEYLAVHPQLRGKERTDILNKLSDAIDEFCLQMDVKKIFSVVNRALLKKRMKYNGHGERGDYTLMVKEF